MNEGRDRQDASLAWVPRGGARRERPLPRLARLLVGALALLGALDQSAPVHAQIDGREDELAVRIPVRLTAGPSDHLMASYAAERDALYFIGDEYGTTEIFVQAPVSGAPTRLFDALGDHAFPRVSPDGTRIAYISFVRDAKGDACVRDLPEGSERCVTGSDTAELEVLWLDEGSQLGVLTRPSLHGDFELQRISAGGGRPSRVLQRNVIGLARSPDARHLAYVELEARRPEVGVSFASRVGRGIRVVRLPPDGVASGGGAADSWSASYTPELPGVSGFPAFSRDGRFIYFSQYLNDTNRDGVIDGGDNSVIVRVGFDPNQANPFAGQQAEQLTSSRWNCHYPAPTATRILMTCSHGGSLDIYSLPLDGVVPAEWDTARLDGELGVARDLWAKLLIASRLVTLLPAGAAQERALKDVVALHLGLREYESALYYADRLRGASPPAASSSGATWASLMRALTLHRRADLALTRGQLSRAYALSERERLAEVLGHCIPSTDADACALAHVIASEILDDLGEKRAAVERLESIELAGVTDPHALRLYGDRVLSLYALLGERDAVVRGLVALAAHPSLPVQDRIARAVDAVAELQRGRGRNTRERALSDQRARAPQGGELALMLDVELALNTLLAPIEGQDYDPAGTLMPVEGEAATERGLAVRRVEEAARERIFGLYTAETDPDRRRAIALRTVQFASRHGSEFLQYQFATTWASGVLPEAPERRYAAELYRAIVLERAYGELHEGQLREASGYFFQASRNADALDAHIGFIETRIAQAVQTPAEIQAFYDERFAQTPDDPAYLFATAYLSARELPSRPPGELEDERFGQRVDLILRQLARVDAAWPRHVAVHHLWGFVRHEESRRMRSRGAASEANQHYLLALDLARERPRARASLLQALGTLQASLGNHRRALEHFERRARLPFPRPAARLAFQLARARSLFHARRPVEALAAAREAMQALTEHPPLRAYRALVLDQLAFQLARNGEHAEAATRYAELLEALSAGSPSDNTPINRLKASIGLASARRSLREHRAALEAIAQGEAILAEHGSVSSRPEGSLLDRYVYGPDRYRALLLGLRAESLMGLGELADAEQALAARGRLLRAFFDESDSEDDLMALAQAELRRGVVERARGRHTSARQHLETGWSHIVAFNERTGSVVTDASQGLLQNLAELQLFEDLPAGSFGVDVPAALEASYAFMTRFPSPRWRQERLRLELYLVLYRLRADGV